MDSYPDKPMGCGIPNPGFNQPYRLPALDHHQQHSPTGGDPCGYQLKRCSKILSGTRDTLTRHAAPGILKLPEAESRTKNENKCASRWQSWEGEGGVCRIRLARPLFRAQSALWLHKFYHGQKFFPLGTAYDPGKPAAAGSPRI